MPTCLDRSTAGKDGDAWMWTCCADWGLSEAAAEGGVLPAGCGVGSLPGSGVVPGTGPPVRSVPLQASTAACRRRYGV